MDERVVPLASTRKSYSRGSQMEVREAVENTDAKTCQSVLLDFLDKYTNPAFGVLPKREIDLLVFEILEKLNYIEQDSPIYTLVQRLRITRSKARNLVYDRELRKYNESELNQRVREALKSPLILKDGDVFKIEIENPLVEEHLRSTLRRLNHTSDAAFRSGLVTLSLDAMAALIEDMLPPDKVEVVRQALVKAGAPDKSLKGILIGVLGKVGNKLADKAGKAAAEEIGDYLGPLVDGAVQKSGKVFRDLLKQESD
jgi:hypothetical protein